MPFVCGARDLGEALRRIAEGASMIRTKGEPGTGDVVQAVRHMRAMNADIRRVQNLREDELFEAAKQLQVPVDLLRYVHENGKLPVVNFAAGGVATPADAALMMQLGAEGVFVGSDIFKSGDPAKRAALLRYYGYYREAQRLWSSAGQLLHRSGVQGRGDCAHDLYPGTVYRVCLRQCGSTGHCGWQHCGRPAGHSPGDSIPPGAE